MLLLLHRLNEFFQSTARSHYRSRDRCWAAIPFFRHLELWDHVLHSEVDELDNEAPRVQRSVLCQTHKP